MTDSSYIHYILVIDRSGSMGSIREVTEKGIREFISGQQAALPPGHRATLSLFQFDTVHDAVCLFAPLKDVPPYTLIPRNGTALLDAAGFAITGEGEKLAATDERDRPGKVVVLIATDGLENSSREWTREQVRDLIRQQQDGYGWQFTFIGANQDAFAEAGGIGVATASVLSYHATSRSTDAAWRGLGKASARYASGQSASVAFTPEEQAEAAAGGTQP